MDRIASLYPRWVEDQPDPHYPNCRVTFRIGDDKRYVIERDWDLSRCRYHSTCTVYYDRPSNDGVFARQYLVSEGNEPVKELAFKDGVENGA